MAQLATEVVSGFFWLELVSHPIVNPHGKTPQSTLTPLILGPREG